MKYRKLKGYKYELMQAESIGTNLPECHINSYAWISSIGMLHISVYYCWDGPSGPTFDTKTFMRGSLIHDALYQLMREGLLDRKHRKYADELLRKICLEDGMSKFRAWYVYRAVRMFCKKSSMPRKNPRGEVVEI